MATVVQGPSLLTNTSVHRPSPSLFHLPGLRSLPVWTRPGFSSGSGHKVAYNDPVVSQVVEWLESHAATIKEEYFQAVWGVSTDTQTTSFSEKPLLESDYLVGGGSGSEHGGKDNSLHSGNWDWHSYYLHGIQQERFAQYCPKTAACVDEIEKQGWLFSCTKPFGFCFFSTLSGNSSIAPHVGPMNLRLRIHLPLLVPALHEEDSRQRPSCGIQVGSHVSAWHENQALVLDDSYLHQVWNETKEPRVVFLVDIWHPDVAMEERHSIKAMFDYAKEQGWMKSS